MKSLSHFFRNFLLFSFQINCARPLCCHFGQMYVNSIATSQAAAAYFIVYILTVSIIIANIFVGILLANGM